MNNNTFLITRGRILVFLVLLLMGTGCSSSKFSQTTIANLSPFADNTIVMLGDADYGFTRDESLVIQAFIDPNSPIWQRLDELAQEADELFKAIMTYSVNIVTLSESSKTDIEKAVILADYLAEFEDEATTNSHMTSEEYQAMITDIRSQQRYLDALKSAEPLLNEVGRYGIALMEEDEKTINTVVDEIETKINDKYEVMLNFQKLVEDQKEAVLQGLQLIRNFYHTGDSRMLEVIVNNLPRLQVAFQERSPSSAEDALELEDLLIEHLVRLKTITEQLESDFNTWEQAHRELDLLHAQALENNRRAKLTLTIWLRAYHKMASGVQNPAEWFSLGDLLKLGNKAVDKAL